MALCHSSFFTVSFFSALYIHKHIDCHQQDNCSSKNSIHHAGSDGLIKEIEIAVGDIPEGCDHFGREAGLFHFGKYTTHGVITDEGCAIGAGQKAYDPLQSLGKLGYRHISTADKAVAGADDGTHSGDLPLAGQEETDDTGKSRTKHHQQKYIQQQE